MSDMLDVNQSATSATVRSNAGAATLHERSRSAEAVIRNLSFNSDRGAVEQFNGMYRVYVTNAARPIGSFQIELFDTVDLSAAVIDLVTLPSDPVITVFASSDGISQVQATEVSRSGYIESVPGFPACRCVT